MKRNIYDRANDALFDANGKLIANRLAGYTDLDWAKDVERTGYRQDYTLSGAVAGEIVGGRTWKLIGIAWRHGILPS